MNFLSQKEGFTLTEVLIGMTLLTIAIVSATNLLVSLIGTNDANVKSLQAYYLAQEGIEGVRNIRDSNWLHGRSWLSDDDGRVWGENLRDGGEKGLSLLSAWSVGSSDARSEVVTLQELAAVAPWKVVGAATDIAKIEDAAEVYWSSEGSGEATGFQRMISVKPYEDCGLPAAWEGACEDYVLVKSRVVWAKGEVELEAVLTDWQ